LSAPDLFGRQLFIWRMNKRRLGGTRSFGRHLFIRAMNS
jgi:hypothetical protein